MTIEEVLKQIDEDKGGWVDSTHKILAAAFREAQARINELEQARDANLTKARQWEDIAGERYVKVYELESILAKKDEALAKNKKSLSNIACDCIMQSGLCLRCEIHQTCNVALALRPKGDK